MADLHRSLLAFDQKENLQLNQYRLLLAVSGGIDSVVLAHLCKEAGYTFAMAHCNFKLRGSESDEDARFVRELAKKLDVSFFEKEFDTSAYSANKGLSIQMAARELRYNWFGELLTKSWDDENLPGFYRSRLTAHASRILTAHHRDDSIETLLINFFKGTGISGLHGIRAKNGSVIRPLLFASRADIEGYAKEQNLEWREDRSNSDTKYLRNAVRHELLPRLEEIFPGVRNRLAENTVRFGEVEQLYRRSVEIQVAKLLRSHGSESRVAVRSLLQTEPLDTILFELSKPFGFIAAQLPTLRQLLASQPGKFLASPTHRAIRHGAWLVFAPLQEQNNSLYVLEKEEGSISFGNQVLRWEFMQKPSGDPDSGSHIALLDAAQVQFPLILRRWKAGDYFYPLGMRKKKKLARFFIDSKLSKTQKEQVWVIESHRKIVWVAGRRIDDRFKITDNTKQVLSLRLTALVPAGSGT